MHFLATKFLKYFTNSLHTWVLNSLKSITNFLLIVCFMHYLHLFMYLFIILIIIIKARELMENWERIGQKSQKLFCVDFFFFFLLRWHKSLNLEYFFEDLCGLANMSVKHKATFRFYLFKRYNANVNRYKYTLMSTEHNIMVISSN